jgi:TonB family protein
MRNKLRIAGLLAVVLMAISAPGQTTPNAAAPAVPILQRAALPVYPSIAKAARVTGKVIVRVTVKDGLVVQTNVLSKAGVSSGQRFLETPTVENLRTWRFASNVTGTFTVTYTYEISGKESNDPTNPRVEMLPSLDVKITARPVKPTAMYEQQSGHAQSASVP